MQAHIDQVNHNLEFHGCIVENYPLKFYDWKITVLFYAAIHCLKALALKRKVEIGHTHEDIFRNINPRNTKRVMQMPNAVFDTYSTLYRYSRTARYNGITDIRTHEELKALD